MNEYLLKDELIGLTFEEAKKHNYNLRVYKEDGTPYVLTMDFVADRINVELYNGLIINLYLG